MSSTDVKAPYRVCTAGFGGRDRHCVIRPQGTIKCSNLCTEILEYTSPEETAVCNLASIALPRFVRERGVASDRVKLTGSLNAPQRWVPRHLPFVPDALESENKVQLRVMILHPALTAPQR